MRAARVPFLPASILPYFLGVSAAEGSWGASVWLGAVAVAAGHAAGNLANELADDTTGADAVDPAFLGLFGGSKLLQEGRLSRRWYRLAALLCLATVCGCVGVISWLTHSPAPIVGLAAGTGVALLYSLSPFNLMGRGWGELAIFLAFGPVCVIAGYFCRSGEWLSPAKLLYTVVAGGLTASVLVANEVPDLVGDSAVGKRNLVVRMGARWGSVLYLGLVVLSLAAIAAAVGPAGLHRSALACLLGLPVAIHVARQLPKPRPRAAFVPLCAQAILLHHLVHVVLVVVLLMDVPGDTG